MGVFRRFIVDRETGELPEPAENLPDDGLITVPNAMTVSRPVAAGKVAKMLIDGERSVTPWMAYVGISDMEGKVGRFFDEHFPQLRLGTSEFGEKADPIADTMAILEIGAAAMLSSRVPLLGKIAIFTALGQEGIKAGWAISRNSEYQHATGERLEIPVTVEGKEAMAEKLAAVGLALLASDLDNEYARQSLSVAALGFAGVGAWRAERARVQYEEQFQELILEAKSDGFLSEAA